MYTILFHPQDYIILQDSDWTPREKKRERERLIFKTITCRYELKLCVEEVDQME